MIIIVLIATFLLWCNLYMLHKAFAKRTKNNLIYTYIVLLTAVCISSLALIIKMLLGNIMDLAYLDNVICLSKYALPSLMLVITILFVRRKDGNLYFLHALHIPALVLLFLRIFVKNIPFNISFALDIYVYITYVIIVSLLGYGSYKYTKKIPQEVLFTATLGLMEICFSGLSVQLGLPKESVSAFLVSVFTCFLYDNIIKHEKILYLTFDIQFILDTISSPILLIDKLGNVLAENKAYTDSVSEIYRGNIVPTNFYDIVREISSPYYNKLKALVHASFAKNKALTKEFTFTFKKKTFNYLLTASPVIHKMHKTPWRKFITNKHTATLLMFKNLTDIKEEKKVVEETKDAIDVQSSFATVGELAAGVAHDINTPITSIKTAISILRSYDLKEEEKLALDQMEKSANKIQEVSTTIRSQFRNMGDSRKETFNFNLLLASIMQIAKSKLEKNNVKCYLDVDPDILLYGTPSKLSQVILNIINNSINAYENLPYKNEGIIIFKAYKGKKNLVITIEDYAGGIPKNIRPYVFKNILATKGASGFGLGLYISNVIIRDEFSGKIAFNCKDNSTSIKISIPLITEKFTIHEDEKKL